MHASADPTSGSRRLLALPSHSWGPAHPLADVSEPGASPAGLVQRLVHVVLHVLLAVRPGLIAQSTHMMHCAVENIGRCSLNHQGCVLHRDTQDAVRKPMLRDLGAQPAPLPAPQNWALAVMLH